MIGIEIEGIFNGSLVNFNRCKFKNWKIKEDGSLRAEGEFEVGFPKELISVPVERRATFFKQLKEFKDEIAPNGEELFDIVSFNSTCGCHIHFSIKERLIANKICSELIKEFRDDFFKGLRELNITKGVATDIIAHYFRKYSKKQRNYNKFNHYGHNRRYKEFNRLSEMDHKGMEWRSFNLLGVSTWKDFFTILLYAYDCINKLLKRLKKGYEVKHRATRFKVPDNFKDDERDIQSFEEDNEVIVPFPNLKPIRNIELPKEKGEREINV